MDEVDPGRLAIADHLLTTTRSVRRRLDLTRPVERALIVDCIRIAQQAPTGSNMQRWRWLVVTDPDVKAGLADLYRRADEEYMGAQAAVMAHAATPGSQGARVFASARHLFDVLPDVPVMVIPCIAGRPSVDPLPAAIMYGSIMPAAWSFMLAARARGLGSSWTCLHLRYEREAAELLGIPDDVTQVALLPVAHVVGDDFAPAARPPVERIISWDRWGNKDEEVS